jgi:hypothetical protein
LLLPTKNRPSGLVLGWLPACAYCYVEAPSIPGIPGRADRLACCQSSRMNEAE